MQKVIVIDDSETDRFIAQRLLSICKFANEIIVKESAHKALDYLLSLEKLPNQLPQLIFLDIRMPEMDGFGFLEEFAKLPEIVKNNCMIIILSTSSDPSDHQRIIENVYVNRFLIKPLSKDKIEQLKIELRKFIKKAS